MVPTEITDADVLADKVGNATISDIGVTGSSNRQSPKVASLGIGAYGDDAISDTPRMK